MDEVLNTIQRADCIEAMNRLPAGCIDLVFADPPFNIGYSYDVYEDSVERQQYIDWSSRWIAAVQRVLKPSGTFWLAIGDDYAAELKLECQKVGFHCRSWVIWYYTFGVNCTRKFTRSHTHLFHFVKDPQDFTFRDEDLDNRIPSARELVYDDRRANPKGRLPDDTWIIRPSDATGELTCDEDSGQSSLAEPPVDSDQTFTLRPQDLGHCFGPDENTWYFPRVAGTFKERAGFHGCQMPEQLLGRIIRICSNPGQVVLDPFSGSATTLAVAKKLGRHYVGFEISKDYVRYGLERLSAIRVGDRLDGSPEPMKSAPRTPEAGSSKKGRNRRPDGGSYPQGRVPAARERHFDAAQLEMTLAGVARAFGQTHQGFSIDRVITDPDLDKDFIAGCGRLGLAGDSRTWNLLLLRLRKAGRLSQVETDHRTHIAWEECDPYLFASEIAWQSLLDDASAASLDEILCDPLLAERFDGIASRFAPDYRSADYRWTALQLRKQAKAARSRGAVLAAPDRLGKAVAIDELEAPDLPEASGLYVLSEDRSAKRNLYVGETLNLRGRLTLDQDRLEAWRACSPSRSVFVQTLAMDFSGAGRLAWQSCLVRKLKPRLNCFELH
jgi:DNA modification methylase